VYSKIISDLSRSFDELEELVGEHDELRGIVRARAHFLKNIKSIPRATDIDDFKAHKVLQIWRVMSYGTHTMLGDGDPRCLLTMAYHELVVLLFEALMPVERHSYFMTGKAEVIKRINEKKVTPEMSKRCGIDEATYARLMKLPYIIAVNYLSTGQIFGDRVIQTVDNIEGRHRRFAEDNDLSWLCHNV